MTQFDQLLRRLADAGLDFVIVGGYAATAHGAQYVTWDLDICFVLSPENIEKLRHTLADCNPCHRMTPQRLSFLQHPTADEPPAKSLYLQTDLGVLDILSSITGVGDFERLRRDAVEVKAGERTYRVISLEDLIHAKETLRREKDLLVARELRVIAAKREQHGQR
jgi:predicted nucleotidyltransferase